MTRRCVLDCARLRSVEAVYDALADQLRLPTHFGRNLDALWDMLTTDVPGPVEIVLANEACAAPEMRSFLARLHRLLRDAARQRADLRLAEE